VVPVPDKDLPVTLPEDVTFDKPGNPLDHHPTWKHVACPQCGGKARRETDTMDTFRRFVLVLRALHRSVERERADRPQGRRPAGCRSTSISAASSTRSCICSTRASSPAR
jgi:leucyl-tRNA synthetase